jgi:phage gp36-like protein
MSRLLTVAEFKVRSVMPNADIDLLEAQEPGYLQACLDDWAEEIESRLRKRYAVPFTAPYPRTVLRWLVKLVTRDGYHKLGYNPSSQQDRDAIDGAAERVEAEMKEAADAKDGLFDLPLRANSGASGVSRGGPLGYSEQSPYVWADLQRRDSGDYR